MPGAVKKTPMKRVLAEATNTRANVQASPRSAKKLKLDNGASTNGRPPIKAVNGSFNSSQPQSEFEGVLEQMTQDIETLKQTNTERDQQWRRPPLPEDFDAMTHNVTFQQIEAEEGVLNGGKATVKLFGVTQVRCSHTIAAPWLTIHYDRMATLFSSMSQTSSTTSTSPRRWTSSGMTATPSRTTLSPSARRRSTYTRP